MSTADELKRLLNKKRIGEDKKRLIKKVLDNLNSIREAACQMAPFVGISSSLKKVEFNDVVKGFEKLIERLNAAKNELLKESKAFSKKLSDIINNIKAIETDFKKALQE